MKKPMLISCLVALVAVALYFGSRSIDLGALIMHLHGR
jgi:hypothetical protein